MSDPKSSVTKARSAIARLHRGTEEPDPELLALARANMACAKIDARIREVTTDAELNGAHVGHLVGLLLMQTRVGGETVQLIEKLAADAVASAQTKEA